MFISVACFLIAASTLDGSVAAVVEAYQAAMEARSLEKLALVFDPDLVVLEGTHQNVGWTDYRDHHIGPEMKEWSGFKVLASRITDSVVEGGLAFLVLESNYRITTLKGPATTIAAAETLVLRLSSGRWRIRHLHFSSKKSDPKPADAVKP